MKVFGVVTNHRTIYLISRPQSKKRDARKKVIFPCQYLLFLVVVHTAVTGNNSMNSLLYQESREFPTSTETIPWLARTLQVNFWVKIQSQEMFRNTFTKH